MWLLFCVNMMKHYFYKFLYLLFIYFSLSLTWEFPFVYNVINKTSFISDECVLFVKHFILSMYIESNE